MNPQNVTWKLKDSFGKEYVIVEMAGSGFCGFHCLAYSLTGDPLNYSDVIRDCITVFGNIPELFHLRTNFATRGESATLESYATSMSDAQRHVSFGIPIESDLWCEDGHFAAMSLLYDVAIFVYSTQNKEWQVFNESGMRGYICLLSTPGHFDVLRGVRGPPAVPHAARSHGVSRSTIIAPSNVWSHLERNYSFENVFRFPAAFAGVHTLGCAPRSDSAAEDDVVTAREGHDDTSCTPGRTYADVVKGDETVFHCDFPNCTYSNEKSTSLRMHKLRAHGGKQCVSLTSESQTAFAIEDSNTAERQADHTDDNTETSVSSRTGSEAEGSGWTRILRRRKPTAASSVASNVQARKSHVSDADDSKKKKTLYTCNVDGCNYTTEKLHTLTTHTLRTHCKERDVTQSTVTGKRKNNTAKSIASNFQCQNMTAEYVCHSVGCGRAFYSERGLCNHKRTCQKRQAPVCKPVRSDRISTSEYAQTMQSRDPVADIQECHIQSEPQTVHSPAAIEVHSETFVSDNSSPNRRDSLYDSRSPRTTRKHHIKKSFSNTIGDLEKEFLPSTGCQPQSDHMYEKLKTYHDLLLKSTSNTTTEKLSSEVLAVLSSPAVIDDCDRQFLWSKDDENRLNELNKSSKLLEPRTEWTWGAADHTEQGKYNDKRMQLCVTKECEWKLIDCNECGSTGLLVGDQTDSSVCHDCVKMKRVNEKERTKKQEAWNQVQPKSRDFPKNADGRDLPYLNPGDKAVIAPVHPVVTVKKNSYANKRLRLESISLVQDPVPTWCKILPRTSLAGRFMIIERRVQNSEKYIVANPNRVRQWLRYLFANHRDFVRLSTGEHNLLEINEAAIEALGPDLELAEVDSGLADCARADTQQVEGEDGLTDPTVSSGFSETHIFSFDRYPELYLKTKDIMRIRKQGKLEIIKDDTVRRPTYCTSANLAFPYLYPHGEMSPLDFQDYKLGRHLLKKQALYAHRMGDGRLQWNYAEDDIHMAHQFSRLSEQTVRATVGYYVSSHPSVAHIPLNNIITAFRDGVDKDSGLLDSHLPDLTTVMTQLPNSRSKWFCERLGIEAISRDIGSPNLFVTINLDPRASPDVRGLIYKLETGKDMDREEEFLKDTAEFTRLMSKYAVHVAIYLYRKVKIMMHTFFSKICRIREYEPKGDWTEKDVTDFGWFWGRVEFTETRGVQHWHFLVKLPHVLDTGLLGRMIHNGRVVRQEMKCGNIKPEKREEAWQMIEMGLLASRYAALFAHSISMASFYDEDVDIDDHDDNKVISLEKYRKEYASNYKEGNINLETHPIMRRYDDPECHTNQFHEMAQVASVSCLHQCIRGSCGGDPLSGDGCRFDFPKKPLNHTVAAVMQVNANQMEARILLRRTCDRVANLNRYLIRYLRSNHDVSVLIDSAHKLRYATKYCAKSGKHSELLNEMIEHLNKRSTELLPPNMKQTLTHLLLADCSHRAFISKQELAYKVMGLPDIMKSFKNVDIVGFYQRAHLHIPYDDEFTVEYSDRTEYSAYAERCRRDTELGSGLSQEGIESMPFNEFAQTIQHKWINSTSAQSSLLDETTKRKFRTRDVKSGHWRLTLCRKRRHTRPSTVLYTAPAIDYEFVEYGKTTTQTTFFDLPIEKRHQLYRSYYELVMYVPWKNTPDESFLSEEVRSILGDNSTHVEIDCRHSLQRLEEFFKVYTQLYDDGQVAPRGSAWHKDNQFSYSMFLVNHHNRDIHLDRVDNKGILKAQYEDVDELVNVDVDIRPSISGVTDLSEYPTFENFMPADIFRDIMDQKAPELSEIYVAFPLQYQWQRLEEVATHDKAKRFIANPPPSPVDYDEMTPVQKFAVDRGIDDKQQILFLCGKAGSGKTAVALKICEHFRGRVQATAYTGKAASLFNGPTIHSMFGWSHSEHRSVSSEIKPDSKKVSDFRVAHENIDLFIIEEALAVPPACFALMDEMMTAAFNAKRTTRSRFGVPPFGGKKVLFLGDQSQLPPIGGPAVYDERRESSSSQIAKRESKQSQRTKAGQLIFEKYLVPNCIYFHKGQRNCGLLGEICDRMRHGTLTEQDCTMLTYQKIRYPDVCTDYGIHYQNDMCAMHNWRQLWNECLMSTPPRRFFVCHATYHVTGSNDDCIEALKSLPPQAYDYAPDILCIAESCQVRLLQNINTAAGLVTSQSGTVVKVIYNNADANRLLAGEHVVPYCIVVSFPAFQGFVSSGKDGNSRIFPFPAQRTWVPIFRKRFSVKVSYLPTWVRKKQLEKECFRIQFPLDLANHITAHRAQGQTLAECLVSVDLGLENPDMRLPPEIASILYVACTRVTKLENLFVSAIHPNLWKKIGQNEVDKYKRNVDERLQEASKAFASVHGKYEEMVDELQWTADYDQNAEEWQSLQRQKEPPKSVRLHGRCTSPAASYKDFHVVLGDIQFSIFSTPVLSERHIGVDQGIKNFAVAVVERTIGENPSVVAVHNYANLALRKNFKESDVVVALAEHTDLMSWMKCDNGSHKVDRVIVHLEQIDVRNRSSKQFSVELGKRLQEQAADSDRCIVKMSQPHIHRATGPLFNLGEEIVETLQLESSLYFERRSRVESNPSVSRSRHCDTMSDVEPSDDEIPDESAVSRTVKTTSQEYRIKKKISSDVFRYIIEADENRMKQMKLNVEEDVQHYWRAQMVSNPKLKLDDAGDALLHALDELLCGSTNFKQLVPAAPSVHVNRTVAVAVFPDTTYWVVLNCRWNTFVFENFGFFNSALRNRFYKDQSVVDTIVAKMTHCEEVAPALREFQGCATYDTVDHIKVVVKQLTGHTELGLKNEEAGTLTYSTTKALKQICDNVIGVNSKLCERKDKILGSIYVRTSTVNSDRKYQVINSTGKHTNAILSCLSWMKQNLPHFVESRREIVHENEKRIFFDAMLKLANSDSSTMEMLQLSHTVKNKFSSRQLGDQMHQDITLSRNIADLVLIAISKNQQHVKAIAANSRQSSRTAKPQTMAEEENDVEL